LDGWGCSDAGVSERGILGDPFQALLAVFAMRDRQDDDFFVPDPVVSPEISASYPEQGRVET
jgi:hypothetical protein